MIKKITDSDKFICKVIGITGKEVKEKEFATYEEACKYKSGMETLKNIYRVEIYTENNTVFLHRCSCRFGRRSCWRLSAGSRQRWTNSYLERFCYERQERNCFHNSNCIGF